LNNVLGLTEVGLGVFGGSNLDMQATDLPSGLSPGCSDVAFLPGSVFTRPSLERLLTAGSTSQCVYSTTYLKPDDTLVQLQFMADGKMYADGVQFGTTRAGNRFQTCNAFGKTYIAVSDGAHGADVPLQLTPEGYLDRVSQDGPGAAPTITNYALPAVSLVAGSAGSAKTITNAVPINPQQVQTGGGDWDGTGGYNPPQYETYYTSIQFTTTTPHGLSAGDTVLISGNSLYSLGTVSVSAIDSTTVFEVGAFQQSAATGTGGTVTFQSPLLVRNNNSVTATTASPHSLRAGYKVTISGVPDATQTISTIVVNNDTLNGEATVTMASPHGLVPGNTVSISGVPTATVGGSISSYSIVDGTVQVTTASNHGLSVGAAVIVTLNTSPALAVIVETVTSLTSFTFSTTRPNSTGTVGSVQLPWPVESGATFTIDSVPSPTTFTFAFTSSDGTWSGGTLAFSWNGQFYVTAVTSATSFTYNQAGPNASIQTGTGTVTPTGQISPGVHTCVEIFLTRTGYLTIPSPPVTIAASGSQYLLITSTAIGNTPNIIARWFAFTGADGGRYFVLPVPPRNPSGQFAIGTSTVIPDNVTDSAIFDFTDEALFGGFAIDIAGNNLFAQQVLGPVLAFFSYRSRLFSLGERNKVQFFKNMGFEGGIYSASPNNPLGWIITGSDGVLTAGDYGAAWQATTATISQSAYQNQNGTAILDANTQFTYRAWVNGTSIATLSSASSGFTATAQITGTGNFAEARFSAKTPAVIPSDLIITISQSGLTTHDELEIIYSDNPYILTAKGSYVNNPEANDGVTAPLGPAGDPHPVIGMQERKDILCLLTAGPEGSLYETQDTASGEPATWDVNHRASKCGLISVWGMAKFEDWFCWTSDTGLRIFDGANVEKMSQEIQPWWNTLNPAAKQFTVLANDPYTRRVYISAATGSATVCNEMQVLDYRDLNTAGLLANSGTLHIGYTGKVVTTDLTRKWAQWSMTMNYMGLLTLTPGLAVMGFCGGTGVSLSDAAHGAVYSLVEGEISGIDADYGPFWNTSHYPIYFMVGSDEAEQRQMGRHRLLHCFMSMNITGVGKVYAIPHLDRIGNTGNPTRALAVTEDLARDLEFALNNAAERISYDICCVPAGALPAPPTAQAGFRLSSLTVGMKTHPFSPIRGRNG
jgi:hypothetical protein